MRKVAFVLLGSVLGFLAGAFVGTLCGMLWITIFPPDRISGGPEAGFNIAFGSGLVGEVIGIVAGVTFALRHSRSKQQS